MKIIIKKLMHWLYPTHWNEESYVENIGKAQEPFKGIR